MQQREVLACPACASQSFDDEGEIPPASVFAGQHLRNSIPGGRLLKCRACHLNWRSLVCASRFYDSLYANAYGDEWRSTELRRDHQLVATALQKHMSGGDVLDIGCGNGALLDLLPAAYRKFGIEIGTQARTAAASRGVNLVGRDFDDLRNVRREFDAIVACDVIEHATNPAGFLSGALSRLRPNGIIVLSTGNADTVLWRVLGGKFWYSQFAEHLTFISPRWISAQRDSGLELVEFRRFAYWRMTLFERAKAVCMLAFYLIAPRRYARRVGRRLGWRGNDEYSPNPPGNGLTRDHFVAIARKTAVDNKRRAKP